MGNYKNLFVLATTFTILVGGLAQWAVSELTAEQETTVRSERAREHVHSRSNWSCLK